MDSIFNKLNSIDVSDKVEKKQNLSYLSWAYAWGEVKKLYPNANYTIYERNSDYGPINYFTDGHTCWVKTGVTIEGLEHIEQLPVMDYRNKSIEVEKVTSFDVNKAIQRSLTKALARHGLGLYIYAGEDLPESKRDKPSDSRNAMIKKVQNFAGKHKSFAVILEKEIENNSAFGIDELPDKVLKNLEDLIINGQHTFTD